MKEEKRIDSACAAAAAETESTMETLNPHSLNAKP